MSIYDNTEEFSEWVDDMISKTEYWVEASDFERFSLYKESGPDGIYKQHKWNDVGLGAVIPLGRVMDYMPVNLSITWVYILDKLVAFYFPCSMVIDYRLVDKFLKDKKKTDAMNFHICINYLEDPTR